MGLEIALAGFHGINSASKAFTAARERSSPTATWPRDVGFVEHHENGKLVLRGNFAGHYVDADEALHVSQHGAAEGWLAGAVLGAIFGGPPGFAAGMVTGGIVGSQLAKGETDPEPQALVDRLRALVPIDGSAIVLIAQASEVDELLAATGEDNPEVTRQALTDDDVAALRASLTASPTASPGPSISGEEAVEESQT
jgi:uncharacterized membrane protein